MKKQLNAVEMLESYLYEVGKRLPSTGKEDILKELRSNIEDQIKGQDDLKGLKSVLSELGSPDSIAAHYSGKPRYLIGPELYETYWMVMVIVGVISFMGTTLGDFLSGDWVPVQGNVASQAIIHMLNSGVEICIGVVGTVTIIFIFIEYFLQQQAGLHPKKDKNAPTPWQPLSDKTDWSPEKLEPVPLHKDYIKLSDSIWDTIWVVIGFGILNFGLDKVASYYFKGTDGVYHSVPFINQAVVGDYLLWINLLFAGSFALCLYQLVTQRWNGITRILDCLMSLLMIGFVVGLLTSPNLVLPGAFEEINALVGSEAVSLEKGVMVGIQSFLAVFVIIEIFNIAKHGFAQFGKK